MLLGHRQAWGHNRFPGSLFQCSATLSVKNLFLISNLNFLRCSLKPVPRVLSPNAREKRPAPPSPPASRGSCRQQRGHPSVSSKLNKPRILSRSSVMPSSPCTDFVAILWTRFKIGISFLHCGAQNSTQDLS